MNFKILNTIGPDYPRLAKENLEKLGSVTYEIPSQEKLEKIIGDYDITVIGLGLNFDKSILDAAKKLKAIATATTGLDHIDTKLADSRKIKVISLRGETDFLNIITGTAELAFGLIIDLARRTPFSFDDVKKGNWDREKFRGRNLVGKNIGIIGLGRLGSMVAKFAKAFGMNVFFTDPNIDQSDFGDYRKVELDELFRVCDVISIHVHLKDDTEGMINRESVKKMKKGVTVVNTSRGKIVNESAALDALRSGQWAGYGTDVLSDELDFKPGKSNSSPMIEYAKENENIIITPHIGGCTHESREMTDVFIAEKLVKELAK